MHFFGFDVSELLILATSLIAAGFLAGILAGLLGIGGGVILVPVLFQLFTFLKTDSDIIMHVSVATSLAIIIPTSIRSLRAHMAKQAVDIKLLKTWILPVLLGAVTGSSIISFIDGHLLKIVFTFFIIIIGLKLIFDNKQWTVRDDIPFGFGNNALSYFIGFFSTLMGIGGGTLGVSYMTLCGRSIHQSIATSSGLGLLISIPATLGFIFAGQNIEALPALSLGYVNLIGVAIIIPASVLSAPIGVKLAHLFPKRSLEIIFACLLFSVAIRFIISLY